MSDELEKLRLEVRLAELRQRAEVRLEAKLAKIAELLEEYDSPNTTHMRRETLRKILVFAYKVQLPSNDMTPECKAHTHTHHD